MHSADHQSEPEALNYFGIDDDSDSSEPGECSSKANNSNKDTCVDNNSDKRNLPEDLPSSKFWQGNQSVEYKWNSHLVESVDDVDKTSKTQSKNDETVKSHSLVGRKRKLEHVDSNDHEPSTPVKLYIHHRVKPHLHQEVARKMPSHQKLFIQNAHASAINQVVWNIGQYSHLLVTASMDRTVKIWNAFSSDTKPLSSYHIHDKAVKQAVWFSQGTQFLSASYDKTCKLIDVVSGRIYFVNQ